MSDSSKPRGDYTNFSRNGPVSLCDRMPPQNLEAEQGVLGSILLDNDVLPEVTARLTPDDFYRASHGVIYRVILDLDAAGEPIDAIILTDELKRRDQLQFVGGEETVSAILGAVPHAANAKYYAGIVRQNALKRAVIDVANEALRDGYANECTAEDLLGRAAGRFEGLAAAGATAERVTWTMDDLEAADLDVAWLVRGVLVAGQPCIVGAPKKSMKTSVVIDLFVSLASGTPFLGKFPVPRPVKVMLLSGESGKWAIRETCRRVCRAREIDPLDLRERLFFEFRLPSLSDPAQLAELSRRIRARGVEVVGIDPIYLCLLAGAQGARLNTANLFDVGPLLQAAITACSPATPVLVHHSKKSMTDGPYGQPDLDDLSMAGFAEFARQWLLLKRSGRHEPGSGLHRLWLSLGGSVGHSGEWEIEINEGRLLDDFTGRTWKVTVQVASEARAAKAEQEAERQIETAVARQRTRDAARDVRVADDAKALHAALGVPATRRQLRKDLHWGYDRLAAAVAAALGDGTVEEKTLASETVLRRAV